MPRSSSAVATSWPSLRTERTSTARLGRVDAVRDQALQLRGHRLGLRALVLAAPERHGVEARARCRLRAARSFFGAGARWARRPRGRRRGSPGASGSWSPAAAPWRRGTPAGSRRCSCARRRGSGRSTGRRRRPRPRCGARRRAASAARCWAKLVSWYSSTSTALEALGDAAAGGGLLLQQPDRAQDHLAEVHRPRLVEQPSWCGVEARELAPRARPASRSASSSLAASARAQREVLAGRHHLVLEPVDALDHLRRGPAPGCRACRGGARRGRRARSISSASRSAGVDRVEEGVEAGLERLLLEQPRAEGMERGADELLVGRPRAAPRRGCASPRPPWRRTSARARSRAGCPVRPARRCAA